jgi:hypothetical protein
MLITLTPQKRSITPTLSSRRTVGQGRSDLEELFAEKGLQWQRREFVKASIEKDIRLDNNSDQNKKKLLTWFDNYKHKKKQAIEL